jgi:hypothetical protein
MRYCTKSGIEVNPYKTQVKFDFPMQSAIVKEVTHSEQFFFK